jgi:tetratricopeptide (TPR) repeat protein
MDSQERHDLEKNELAHWLARIGRSLRSYTPHIAIGLLIAAAAVAALVFMNMAAREKTARAWAAYFEAQTPSQFEQLMLDYPDSPVVPYAQMQLAWTRLTEGKQRALDDRGASLQALDEAIERFEKVLKSPEPLADLKPQAALGVAMAKELQARVDEATRLYESIVTEYANQPAAQLAKQMLETLQKPEAAKFYAMLKNYQPPEPSLDLPPVEGGPTFPGLPNDPLGDIALPPSPPPIDLVPGASTPPAAPTTPAPPPPAPPEDLTPDSGETPKNPDSASPAPAETPQPAEPPAPPEDSAPAAPEPESPTAPNENP